MIRLVNMGKFSAVSVLAFAMMASPVPAQDGDVNNRIVDEGMNRSEVMQSAHELVDEIGPRLSNSPQMREAETWAREKFRSWNLKNVRKEGFEFGRGWSITSSDVRMVSPRPLELTAIPVAWTPATNGTIIAPIIVAPISEKAHFDAYRGQLAGKIIMITIIIFLSLMVWQWL